jgi:ABC-type glycerol-3-phosphate transport system permease component
VTEHIVSVLFVAAQTATLLFGGAITALAFRAFRRTGSAALRALTVGIGMLTVGALLGGTLHQFVGLGLRTSVTVQSVATAVGFAVLTYSLYTDHDAGNAARGDSDY